MEPVTGTGIAWNWKLKTVFYLNFAFVLILVLWLLQAFVIETSYLSYTNTPFPLAGTVPVFHPGEKTAFSVIRCNRDKVERVYSVTHLMVNEDSSQPSYVLEPMLTSIKPGCSTAISTINDVPEKALPGRYRFVGFGDTKGVVRSYLVRWETEPFTVVAK